MSEPRISPRGAIGFAADNNRCALALYQAIQGHQGNLLLFRPSAFAWLSR